MSTYRIRNVLPPSTGYAPLSGVFSLAPGGASGSSTASQVATFNGLPGQLTTSALARYNSKAADRRQATFERREARKQAAYDRRQEKKEVRRARPKAGYTLGVNVLGQGFTFTREGKPGGVIGDCPPGWHATIDGGCEPDDYSGYGAVQRWGPRPSRLRPGEAGAPSAFGSRAMRHAKGHAWTHRISRPNGVASMSGRFGHTALHNGVASMSGRFGHTALHNGRLGTLAKREVRQQRRLDRTQGKIAKILARRQKKTDRQVGRITGGGVISGSDCPPGWHDDGMGGCSPDESGYNGVASMSGRFGHTALKNAVRRGRHGRPLFFAPQARANGGHCTACSNPDDTGEEENGGGGAIGTVGIAVSMAALFWLILRSK